jgi:membrane protease YdiL (CAAX protease family)
MYLVAMPVAYLFMRLVPAQKPQKQKLHPLMWIGFLCLCFAVTYVANILGQYFSNWFSNLTGIQIENELEEITVNTPFALNLLFVGILAPVFEELFYRKAVIDRLRRYGDLPAILLSGVAFGLVHGNFNQVFYTTAVGILLSFIYVKTGSVLYTISIHAAFNFIGGVYSTELLRRVGKTLIPAEGDVIGMLMVAAYALFMIASLVIGTIFFIVNVKKFYRSLQKGEEHLTFEKWMRVIFRNPGVWMFLATIVLLFVSGLLT